MPMLFMKIHKTRWLWTFKAFILPPCVYVVHSLVFALLADIS